MPGPNDEHGGQAIPRGCVAAFRIADRPDDREYAAPVDAQGEYRPRAEGEPDESISLHDRFDRVHADGQRSRRAREDAIALRSLRLVCSQLQARPVDGKMRSSPAFPRSAGEIGSPARLRGRFNRPSRRRARASSLDPASSANPGLIGGASDDAGFVAVLDVMSIAGLIGRSSPSPDGPVRLSQTSMGHVSEAMGVLAAGLAA